MELLNFAETLDYTKKSSKYAIGLIHELYDELFSKNDRRLSIKNLLEIGVDSGFSLLLWRDYFVNANVTGIDIKECPILFGEDRISHLIQNAYSLDTIKQLNKFDIIIDDGPHTFESMVFFLQNYPQLCNKGGLVILEDIVYPQWMPELLDLAKIHGSVSYINIKNKMISDRYKIKWKDRDYFNIVIEV